MNCNNCNKKFEPKYLWQIYCSSQCSKSYHRERRKSSIFQFRNCKSSAKERGLVWELSENEFDILNNNSCVYCESNEKIGIDRVDNNRGYIKDNCVSCCIVCNKMKLNYTLEFFIEHCKKIVNYQKA